MLRFRCLNFLASFSAIKFQTNMFAAGKTRFQKQIKNVSRTTNGTRTHHWLKTTDLDHKKTLEILEYKYCSGRSSLCDVIIFDKASNEKC